MSNSFVSNISIHYGSLFKVCLFFKFYSIPWIVVYLLVYGVSIDYRGHLIAEILDFGQFYKFWPFLNFTQLLGSWCIPWFLAYPSVWCFPQILIIFWILINSSYRLSIPWILVNFLDFDRFLQFC